MAKRKNKASHHPLNPPDESMVLTAEELNAAEPKREGLYAKFKAAHDKLSVVERVFFHQWYLDHTDFGRQASKFTEALLSALSKTHKKIPRNKVSDTNAELDATIVSLRESGKTFGEIAKALKKPRKYVEDRHARIKARKNKPPGLVVDLS